MITKTDYRLNGDFKHYQEDERTRQLIVYKRELQELKIENLEDILDFIAFDITQAIVLKHKDNIHNIYDLEELTEIDLVKEIKAVMPDVVNENMKLNPFYIDEIKQAIKIYELYPEIIYLAVSQSILTRIYFYLAFGFKLI